MLQKIVIILVSLGFGSFSWTQAQSALSGRTWQKVEVPTQASFRGLSLPNETCVWISGTKNTVLRSADSGMTWQVFKVGPTEPGLDFRDVWAFDAQTAWVMGAGPGAASTIYATLDGGQTWIEEHTNSLEGAFFDGMTFLNEERGLVYSDPVDGAFMFLERAEGRWQRISHKLMPRALEGEASFAASGTGIFSLGKHIWVGSGGAKTARLFHSADGGVSWTAHDTPLRAGSAAAGIFSVCFRDPDHGVIVGGHFQEPTESKATAAITSDGGQTWQLATQMPHGFRSCVVYVPGSDNTLVSAGTSGIDSSEDGGLTWSPMADLAINVLKFSGSQAWAAGPEGKVARLSK